MKSSNLNFNEVGDNCVGALQSHTVGLAHSHLPAIFHWIGVTAEQAQDFAGVANTGKIVCIGLSDSVDENAVISIINQLS